MAVTRGAEHMGANLLPCNAAVPVASPDVGEGGWKRKGNDYGKGNRLLHTEHLPKKGDLDRPRTTRESNRVLPTGKEVGLSCGLLCSRKSVSLISEYKIAAIAPLLFFCSQLRQPPRYPRRDKSFSDVPTLEPKLLPWVGIVANISDHSAASPHRKTELRYKLVTCAVEGSKMHRVRWVSLQFLP